MSTISYIAQVEVVGYGVLKMIASRVLTAYHGIVVNNNFCRVIFLISIISLSNNIS
jgi:hypothetical protein